MSTGVPDFLYGPATDLSTQVAQSMASSLARAIESLAG